MLKHWYQKFLNWQEHLESNYHTLKRVLETEAQRIEALTYEELQRSAEELSFEISVEEHNYYISLEAINMLNNGDLEICVDISSPKLSTKWGIKPSWHFFKTREGRVYYKNLLDETRSFQDDTYIGLGERMMKMVVLGAGMQGTACAYDLLQNPSVTTVAIADVTEAKAQMAAAHLPVDARLSFHGVDATNDHALSAFLKPYDVLISAVPYFLNLGVSKAAIASRTHMVDMGGNTDLVFEQRKLNEEACQAGVTILPDCGLAPGMANILAAHAIQQLDTVESVKIRVGGLPQNPQPPLNYRLFFSIHGLINEYVGKSVILQNGVITEVDTLTGVEILSFPDSVGELEAFHTLGGLSTLPWTYHGQIKNMDYKTIRYPGHCHQIKTMHDLGLLDSHPVEVNGTLIAPRDVFAAVVIPRLSFEDKHDFVLVRVEATGYKLGESITFRLELLDRYDEQTNFTAMMRTTAYPVSIVAQMLGDGTITERGVLALEKALPTERFIMELAKRQINLVQSNTASVTLPV